MNPPQNRRPLISRPDLGEHPLDDITQAAPPAHTPPPALPEPDAAPTPIRIVPRVIEPAATSELPERRPAAGRPSRAGKTFALDFGDPGSRARVREAWKARGYRMGDDGPLSENAWMLHVLLTEVHRLEDEYNDGKPWQ